MFAPRRPICCLLIALAVLLFAGGHDRAAAQSGEVLLSYHRDQPQATVQVVEPAGEAASHAASAAPINPLRANHVDSAVWPAAHAEPVASPESTTDGDVIAAFAEQGPQVAAEADDMATPKAMLPQSTAADPEASAAFPRPAAPPTRFADPLASSTISEGDPRRLAPRGGSSANSAQLGQTASGPRPELPFTLPAGASLTTAATGLAAVVALFLVCAWLFRRASPQRTGALPAEAFALLGAAPIAGRHVAQLVRLGNKLLLLSITADGVQTLAEITDPAEVDRLTGLCTASAVHGPTAEFEQVLAQLAKEPARGFLGREANRWQ
ncbi:MAG: hypothetical protein CMJ58_10990 [Planctomycetaceae bacterium]|nr:hypothetical protein [Planctomycetaceae bacterium]